MEQLIRRRFFYKLPQIHHDDLVGQMLHNGKVVRYKEVRKPHLLLKILHQVEHLRLNGNIQC